MTARKSRPLRGPVCGRMPPGPLAEVDLIADRGAGQWVCTTNERRSGCRARATIGGMAADGRAVSGGSGSRLRVPTLARPSSRRWRGPATGSPTTRTAWRMRRISAAHAVAWLSPADLGLNWGSDRRRRNPVAAGANFGGSGSDDPHYVVRLDDHGATVVEFGDGVHGDRPSPGSSIAARYRGHHLEVFSASTSRRCVSVYVFDDPR